jgi:hypothetical protein
MQRTTHNRRPRYVGASSIVAPSHLSTALLGRLENVSRSGTFVIVTSPSSRLCTLPRDPRVQLTVPQHPFGRAESADAAHSRLFEHTQRRWITWQAHYFAQLRGLGMVRVERAARRSVRSQPIDPGTVTPVACDSDFTDRRLGCLDNERMYVPQWAL